MALVIGLILLALFLFFVEFLLIPGVTVAGILGALAMVTGIYLAYHTMGSTAGHITLSLATLLSFLIVFFSLRSKTWNHLSLHTQLHSSVETELTSVEILPGDEGVSKSRLAPMGTVSIKGIEVEAMSTGAFIDPRRDVIVVKVEKSRLIVKPKNS